MDLRQLRYFSTIAKHLSFRAAADELSLAQSALSQQIHRLEGELGLELFDRSTRPIRLTPAGEHLLSRSLEILDAVDETAAEMRELVTQHRSRLIVGVLQYLTNLEVPHLIADFARRHPLVDLGLRTGSGAQLSAGLVEGDIDIAICHGDEISAGSEIASEFLREEEIVVIMGHQDARAKDGAITMESLVDSPLIAFKHGVAIRMFTDAFAPIGQTPKVAFESPDMSTVLALVARGLGVALVPRPIAEQEPKVAWLRVADEPLTRDVCLFWRPDNRRSGIIDAFRLTAHRAMDGPLGAGAVAASALEESTASDDGTAATAPIA